jgi:hypothetical protein
VLDVQWLDDADIERGTRDMIGHRKKKRRGATPRWREMTSQSYMISASFKQEKSKEIFNRNDYLIILLNQDIFLGGAGFGVGTGLAMTVPSLLTGPTDHESVMCVKSS